MSTILFIGAGTEQDIGIRKAKEMGLRVIAVDKNQNAPGLKVADRGEVIDIFEIESIIKLAEEESVNGVVGLSSDMCLKIATIVAHKLKLPGLSLDTLEYVTDKGKMRNRMREFGIPQPNFVVIDNKVDLGCKSKTLVCPFIIKPCDNAASRGVTIVRSEDLLERRYDEALVYSRSGRVIVEEFIDGKEYTIDAYTVKGKTHVLCISEKEKVHVDDHFVATTLLFSPNLSDKETEQIRKLIQKITDAFGICNGPTHTEIIINDGVPKVVEVAARGGGFGIFREIIPALTGVDVVEHTIKLALGEIGDIKTTKKLAGLLKFFAYPPGVIKSFSGFDEAKKVKGVLDIGMLLKVGDRIKPLTTDSDRVCYLRCVGETSEEVLKIAEKVQSMIHIKIDYEKVDQDYTRYFSKRASEIKNSASLLMNEKVKMMNANMVDVINLSIGEPHFDTPDEIKEGAINALRTDKTSYYGHSKGLPELRKIIAEYHSKRFGFNINFEDVLITPGAKQAMFYVFTSILNEGDEVIIFEPAWLSYRDSIHLAGGKLVIIKTKPENDFKPDITSIEKRITKKTKLLILNNPVNPTACTWTRDEIKQLVGLAKKHGVLILSDEIYDHIVYEDKFTSIYDIEEGRSIGILLNGFSKTFSMCGWRLGYLIAPRQLIENFTKIQQQLATCPCTSAQYGAVVAMKNMEKIFSRMIPSYIELRQIMLDWITKEKELSCMPIKGTFYAFINIKNYKMTSLDIVAYLLERANVAVVPGSSYGDSGEGFIRICFAMGSKRLKEGLWRISKALREYKVSGLK